MARRIELRPIIFLQVESVRYASPCVQRCTDRRRQSTGCRHHPLTLSISCAAKCRQNRNNRNNRSCWVRVPVGLLTSERPVSGFLLFRDIRLLSTERACIRFAKKYRMFPGQPGLMCTLQRSLSSRFEQ
jgi:hypothetical protein